MIIGVQKCGTSALAYYLEQHPDICMAWGKEVHLFDIMNRVALPAERIDRFYAGYFPHYRGEPLVGESTPAYLYFPGVAARLHHYNASLKLVVILRDPVERALSQYAMARKQGHETRSIGVAFAIEPFRLFVARRIRSRWSWLLFNSYADRGRYPEQLKSIYRHFPKDQVLLTHATLLRAQRKSTLQEVYRFLGVRDISELSEDATVRKTEQKYRPSKIILRWLNWRFRKERRWIAERFPETRGL